MTRMTKHWKNAAILLTLALAFLVPSASLAAGEPVAALYSPTVNAAASANQKIIFSLTERVTLAADKHIVIAGGGSTYTAAASSGSLIGNQTTGPWYVRYDIGDFLNNSDSTPLSLSAGTTYNVTAEAGAFVDADTQPSAQLDASFTTVAGGLAVIFTKTNDTQSVSAGGTPIVSGQSVTSGTALTYSLDDGSYVLARTVKIGGALVAPAALPATVPSGDLELYFVRSEGTLTGDVAISGDPYFGGTLHGSVSGSNQTDNGKLFFRWVRVTTSGDTQLTSGPYGTSYTLTEADIEAVIRLDVTSGVNDGTISAESDAIEKAPYTSSVTAPAVSGTTATSITLQTVSGYQYMLSGGSWQDSPVFSGLTTGQAYVFYQRVKETTTTLASDTSTATSISTMSALTGTVSFSGTPQYGVTLTGSITGTTNASGTITYTWQRGGSNIATGSTYAPEAADIGQALTLVINTNQQSGTISGTSATVLKAANTTTPATPTMASNTATSITLNAVSGYQYSLGGTYWQDTTTFHNLAAGSAYTFYQRVAETATAQASAASASVNFSTLPALSGTVMSSGEARYGNTIVVSLASTNNTGTLSYTWKRGTLAVGTGTSYAVQAADVSNQLSLEVTSSVQGGAITRSFGTVAKAYYVGSTPAAPTRYSRTTTKIVLNEVEGCEYSRGGTTWQDSTTFSGLKSGTSYTFYQRYKATATTEASPTSAAYKTSTSTASDSSSDDSSATPTPKPTTPGSTDDANGTTLYTYSLTDDNTRILYSTMKSLAAGNKTQDVTIKQSNVEFTFPKGTMSDTYTQLWYDFGTTINNSIAEQTAKQIAGDAYVATIHFNYSGELPGKANIRFWLGAAQAGKTLYYYRLEDSNALTFMQTSTVDTTGWASVSQESCSDYVFLDKDYASINATPSPLPSAAASVSPQPSPTVTPAKTFASFASDGWFIAAIILIAVALIVGGIWLYTKNRDEY